MKKNIDNWEVVYFALLLLAMAFLLAGCGHDIHVKGWGLVVKDQTTGYDIKIQKTGENK